jgi:propionyl-CoA synthetase
MLGHPYIAECCVVGMPDSQKGHKPFSFIIPTGISEAMPVKPEKALTH